VSFHLPYANKNSADWNLEKLTVGKPRSASGDSIQITSSRPVFLTVTFPEMMGGQFVCKIRRIPDVARRILADTAAEEIGVRQAKQPAPVA